MGLLRFDTFLAQFQNCSLYNKWTKTEELAYLRSSLEKEASQVLWDYGTEVTNSLKNLTKTLSERFGGANQADTCRIEDELTRLYKVFIRTSEDLLH